MSPLWIYVRHLVFLKCLNLIGWYNLMCDAVFFPKSSTIFDALSNRRRSFSKILDSSLLLKIRSAIKIGRIDL